MQGGSSAYSNIMTPLEMNKNSPSIILFSRVVAILTTLTHRVGARKQGFIHLRGGGPGAIPPGVGAVPGVCGAGSQSLQGVTSS